MLLLKGTAIREENGFLSPDMLGVHFSDLAGIVANSKGGALIFGWWVSVAILSGEGEAVRRVGLKLGGQPLVEVLLRRPKTLTLLIQHAEQSLRLLVRKETPTL